VFVFGGSTEDVVEQYLSLGTLQSVSAVGMGGLFQWSRWLRGGMLQVRLVFFKSVGSVTLYCVPVR
jgi:hypothetical protein